MIDSAEIMGSWTIGGAGRLSQAGQCDRERGVRGGGNGRSRFDSLGPSTVLRVMIAATPFTAASVA